MVMLDPNDFVGVTFWIISVAMVASTAFFFVEAGGNMTSHWRTSVIVAGLVTLIATVHYYYMRAIWVDSGDSPTVLRYIDWLLTVPLQMIEFYLILAAVGAATSGIFWRLLIGTLVMLIGGFMGEAGMINSTVGFVVGMAGWIYILYEVFAGEAAQANTSGNSEAQKSAFNAMKWIVSVGWSIYPIGYFLGYLGGGTDVATVNAVYNLADFLTRLHSVLSFGLLLLLIQKA